MAAYKTKNWPYTFFRVLLFCVCCAVFLAMASRLTKGFTLQWSQHLLVVIAIALTFCLTLFFVRWEGLKPAHIGIVPTNRGFNLLVIGFVVGLFLAIFQPLLVLLFGHVKLQIATTFTFRLFAANFLLYLLIACREELAFRAYPLRSLNYTIGAWKAQFIVATIFALEHIVGGVPPMQAFLGAGVGAIFFGVAALKTKGIALPIGLHTAWNFGQWLLGFKNESGIYKIIIANGFEKRFEHINQACYLFVMISAIFVFQFCWKNIKRPERQ